MINGLNSAEQGVGVIFAAAAALVLAIGLFITIVALVSSALGRSVLLAWRYRICVRWMLAGGSLLALVAILINSNHPLQGYPVIAVFGLSTLVMLLLPKKYNWTVGLFRLTVWSIRMDRKTE